MVAAILKRAAAVPCFDGLRISLRPVRSYEGIAQTFKAVRLKTAGKELVAVLLIVKLVLYHAVTIAAPCGIQAHLEVAVVHVYLVEAEFHIGKHREITRAAAVVSQCHIPQLHRVVHRHHKRLFGVDIAVITEVFDVAQPVPAGVLCLVLPDRLP